MLFSALKNDQKQAVGLLSIGTFLEYFDLMLYVHMAIVLNNLFFPKTDPFTHSLHSAFAFCSVFVLRPFGALLFGYIGDKIGRKPVVVITTFLMALSCLVIATLPTYQQIGITAAWIVTICRMAQGLSSMGEIVSAEIYLTEFIKPPLQYPVVMLVAIASILGGTAALGVATLAIKYQFNWRIAFLIGAGIAMIGGVARTALKETIDFADAQRKLKSILQKSNMKINLQKNLMFNEKVNLKTSLALFSIQCGWPICFFLTYIYCGNILTNQFNYRPEDVTSHNFVVSLVNLFGYFIIMLLSQHVHPLRILKIKIWIFVPFVLLLPYFLICLDHPFQVFAIQSFIMLFVLSTNPATPIFYTRIPIFKRFRYSGFIYAASRALMHIITSFSVLYCEKYFGTWGLWFVLLPMVIGYGMAIFYFVNLEKEVGNYH